MWVPAPRRILDLGCGTGRLLRRAAGRFPGAGLVGLDVSARMLERARALHRGLDGDRLSLVRGDAAHQPFADGSFDAVVCVACSHHWSDPNAVFAEIRRVTEARGVLVLAHLAGIATWDAPAGHSARHRHPGPAEVLLGRSGFATVSPPVRGECTVAARSVIIAARPVRTGGQAAAPRGADCGS